MARSIFDSEHFGRNPDDTVVGGFPSPNSVPYQQHVTEVFDAIDPPQAAEIPDAQTLDHLARHLHNARKLKRPDGGIPGHLENHELYRLANGLLIRQFLREQHRRNFAT